jgi:hypothetical protein
VANSCHRPDDEEDAYAQRVAAHGSSELSTLLDHFGRPLHGDDGSTVAALLDPTRQLQSTSSTNTQRSLSSSCAGRRRASRRTSPLRWTTATSGGIFS